MQRASISRDDVVAAIFAAVDEINAALPGDRQIRRSADTVLFGAESSLDSFTLVNLVIGAEQQLLERLDAAITLASEQAMSRRNSPFRTIGSLADYALELINGADRGG
jgi:hypothetical protein